MPHTDKHSNIHILTALATTAICLVAAGCSSEPPGPRQGTPPWFMQAARDNFAMGDYTKTVEQLKEAARAEGEMGQEALLWRATLTAGLARGYDELTSAFAEGVEANEARTEEFQNSINDYRRRTRVNAIEFSESIGNVKNIIDASETVALNFPIPSGNATQSPVLESVSLGNTVDETTVAAMVDQTLIRGMFSVLSDLTGGAEASKLVADAEAGGIQASAADMSFGIARIMLDISVMFDREGINEPRVREFAFTKAVEWAEPHMENEELGEKLEDFEFDVENERRDMAGKRRMKEPDK